MAWAPGQTPEQPTPGFWGKLDSAADWLAEKWGKATANPCPAPNCDTPASAAAKRKGVAKKALKGPEMLGPAPLVTEATEKIEAEKKAGEKEKPKKDYAGAGMAGASVLGSILAALGDEDSERSKYDLPGAAGPDVLGLGGVDKPFVGRMDMSPEQRQSLALAMLR